ncbi:MAG: hypothetical protein RIB45_02170 [Marivibrio sp.]|uniref:HMA2 domain-containing protein n=1 Tax=Marivibrio sp. TaxID=2039719 RepID=UPI0032EAD9B8
MTATPDLTPFLALRRHVSVAHHVPGRIRVRLAASALKEAKAVDRAAFDRILAALDGVKDVRVNAAAGSAVIAYDPARLPPKEWDRLLTADEETARALLGGWLGGAVET